MSNDYFILEDGEQSGPFSFDDLMEMGLDIHTRILSPNAEGWHDACDLPEFFEYFVAHGINFPTEDNLASFWWRLLAYVVDYIILTYLLQFVFAALAASGIKFHVESYDDLLKLPPIELLKLQLIFDATLVIYNSVCEASPLKGSLGKKLFRIVVVDADGAGLTYLNSLGRSLGKALSFFLVGLGFLSIFWSDHRQALHDYMAKTYVVKL